MIRYPILYSFRRCPYAIRGRMALKKAGIICVLREVALRDKPEAMTKLSPKGTVPVLQLKDETVLDESLQIMRWALNVKDPDNWMNNIDESATLLTELDQNFKTALDKYKYYINYPRHPQVHYRDQGAEFLAILEESLIANNEQGICDSRTTFADIAVFPFVRQFAFVDKDWFDQTPYTHLKTWLTHHLESDLFLSIMHKNIPWVPGNKVQFLETNPAN